MTRNRPINEEEHTLLKEIGELWLFYPECSGNWEEDKFLWGKGEPDGSCTCVCVGATDSIID